MAGLRELYDAGRAAWPGIEVEEARFLEHLRAHATAQTDLHAADLYLSCACALGDRRALEAFERDHLSRVGTFLHRISTERAFVEEVRQLLRTRLLVAEPGHQPRIAQYSGKGPLGAWVRVTAIRAALELRRGLVDAAPEHIAREALRDGPHPELGYIKELYRRDFQMCFEKAIGLLPKRDRTLLRLHYLDGMSLRKIASLYGVGSTTAHRWLGDAREGLLREMSQLLRARLGLSAQDVESLANLMRSQFALTLSRILVTSPE